MPFLQDPIVPAFIGHGSSGNRAQVRDLCEPADAENLCSFGGKICPAPTQERISECGSATDIAGLRLEESRSSIPDKPLSPCVTLR